MSNETTLIFPGLARFYSTTRPLTDTLLRAAFGLTIVTHGLPKMTGSAHGSMAGSINLMTNVLHLPFAPQLAMFVALLKTFGGLAAALGFATRIFAPMLAIQMAFICIALGATYPWIDRGFEYPLILGFVALLMSIHGGGAWSVDRLIGREV
jgi:putative oxidoreductase